MTSDSRRLSILTDQEVDDLYSLPRFTEEDRSLYFDLSPAERELVDGVFTVSVAVHLILQLGYFKAKRQFYVYSLDAVSRDLEHVVRRYLPARSAAEIKPPSRSTRLEHQQVILRLFDYRLCDAAAKRELERKAQRVAMPHYPAGFHSARGSTIPGPAANRGPWLHVFTRYGRADHLRRTPADYQSA
jgi:hypothetical protein